MRKSAIMYAIAALALAACSNDENMDSQSGPVEIRLSSGLTVQEAGTRAADNIFDGSFSSGRKVDVYINEAVDGTPTTTYEQPLTYTTGEGNALDCPTGKQPYFPSSGKGVNIYAVYPSATENFGEGRGHDAEAGTFTIQKDQSSDANYMLSDLMYGKPESNPVERTSKAVPLTFTHLLSKVTIVLKAGSGMTEDKLNDATVTLLGVKPTVGFDKSAGTIGEVSGDAEEITVMKEGTPVGTSASAVIVPQQLSEKFVRIDLADGGVLTGKLDSGQPDLEGGKVYIYTITVNLTQLDITATITPWNDINGNNKFDGTAGMDDSEE